MSITMQSIRFIANPALIACFFAGAVVAETDAQRVTRFQGFFGTGKSARIVWQVETDPNGWPSCFGSQKNAIVKMDTQTGKVDTIARPTTGMRWSDPTFTWNGNRIVYYDVNSYKIHVVNWDGSGDRTLTGSYNGGGRCWRSTDGKDYVLATSTSGSTGRRVVKLNLDDATDATTLLTTTWFSTNSSEGYCNTGTHWVSMSGDGTYLAGDFPDWPDVGFYKIGAASPTLFGGAQPGSGGGQGCWPSISRDALHKVLFWAGDHTKIHIERVDGVVYNRPDRAIPSAIVHGGEPETMRWSNDTNFVAMMGTPDGNSGNPWILRLADMQPMAINTSAKLAEGNCDLYVASAGAEVARSTLKSGRSAEWGVQLDRTGRIRVVGPTGVRAQVTIFDASGKTLTSVPATSGTLCVIPPTIRCGILLYRIIAEPGIVQAGAILN